MNKKCKKVMRVGILPLDQQRERTLAIARGEYKPKQNEPKVWFVSMDSLSRVLSDDNQCLLQTIAEQNPSSLKILGELTGKATSNLSRTLKKMELLGIVKLHKESREVVPEALATAFDIKTAGNWGFLPGLHRDQGKGKYGCVES